MELLNEQRRTTVNLTPIIHLLSKNEGATMALARKLLKPEDFEDFENEAKIQTMITLKEFNEDFPNISDDSEDLNNYLDEKIAELKLKRKL